MNDAQRARILQELLAERDTLARRWYKVLWRDRWERKEEQAQAYFVTMVDRFLALLLSPTAEPEAERRLGSDLAVWCQVPEELIRSQELLTHYLGDQLSAEEAKVLQPRL
ncbi:MAG: hypothetical protein H0T73_19585, partial [Ardenticatenales bacterium]|nr:hypothetical protein [Ardenticatenales bacterium]